MFKVSTFSGSIMVISFSDLTIDSSEIIDFFPKLISSSFSILNLTNNYFHDAYEARNNELPRIAIYMENNNSFVFINNSFKSLTSIGSGGVISFLFEFGKSFK